MRVPSEDGHVPGPPGEDERCIDVFDAVVETESGVVGLRLDPEQEMVSIDYNADEMQQEEAADVARRVGPILHHRWETCTVRLGKVGGRSCETCALQLEQRLQKLPGIERASASYLGGVLSVTYDRDLITPEGITGHVQTLGVPLRDGQVTGRTAREEEEALPETWWRRIDLQRLELILTIITFITMFAGLIAGRLALPMLANVFYVVAYVAGGAFGLKAGLESLRERTIDVDLLMILAALGAALVGAPFEGAMLLFLFSLSNVLQNYALDRTRNAIRELMALRPTEALVRRGERLLMLPLENINIGDRIVVRPGDRIPLDGVVLEGESSVDQAAITGESIPVSKQAGDSILAGSINGQGGLEIGVTRLAKDSTIARLIQLVEEAQSEKAPTQRFIDKAEQYYALGVLIFTGLAILFPIAFLNEPFDATFYRAMTLMVAASPCAIVISTPATVLSAIANGARKGVLFKGGAYLEQAAEVKVIAFDKTGTLTLGRPQVTDVIPLNDLSEDSLLTLAAAVESRSEHPLAQAIMNAAEGRNLSLPPVVSAFQSRAGRGVQAVVNEQTIAVSNLRDLDFQNGHDMAFVQDQMATLQDQGKTAVVVSRLDDRQNPEILGIIGIADVLRPDAPQVMDSLRQQGIEKLVMLTGDNERVAQAIAQQVGVDETFAGLMPEEKMLLLKELADLHGTVMMVGDGVNDAPALATADIGLAMGAAGTDVALETADVVLMSDDLSKIPYIIGLSHQTRRILIQNLVFAIGVIIILVSAVLGVGLALPLSVIGHEGSTVIVSLNGLRMLGYNP